MPTLTEGMHAGEALGEFALGPAYHNDKVTVLSGQNLSANAVVGSVPSATVASAAKAGGNTGNGTFVVDATAPAQPRVIEGVYTLRCVTAVTNGGVFRLERPDGVVIGDVAGPGHRALAEPHPRRRRVVADPLDDAVGDLQAGIGLYQ